MGLGTAVSCPHGGERGGGAARAVNGSISKSIPSTIGALPPRYCFAAAAENRRAAVHTHPRTHLAEELVAPQPAEPADPGGVPLVAAGHVLAVLRVRVRHEVDGLRLLGGWGGGEVGGERGEGRMGENASTHAHACWAGCG
jgi:hypothetical protein